MSEIMQMLVGLVVPPLVLAIVVGLVMRFTDLGD